jgi:hypothetical protein
LRLLGGFCTRPSTYAGTYHDQETPGALDSSEAFAEFAEQCKQQGFAGFKIHDRRTGDARREVCNLFGVRAGVGDDFSMVVVVL